MQNSSEQDLFANYMEAMLYDGQSGSVRASDTSRERAETEDEAGVTAKRAEQILEHLKLRREGLTWFELGALLKLHHGQASGALSMLHKSGVIFALKQKRNRCHPYVHSAYRHLYSADQRLDEPVKTKAAEEKDALNALLVAVDELLQSQTWNTIRALQTARALYKDKFDRDDS